MTFSPVSQWHHQVHFKYAVNEDSGTMAVTSQ